VLPVDPVIVRAAVDRMLPDREADAGGRRPFLEAVVAVENRPGITAEQLAAVAQAHDELGHPDAASVAWRRAVELAPQSIPVRDGYSRWLMQQERYEEAVGELERLQQKTPSAAVRDRLDAARHGLKLERGIGK
jgi:hypothetical protein